MVMDVSGRQQEQISAGPSVWSVLTAVRCPYHGRLETDLIEEVHLTQPHFDLLSDSFAWNTAAEPLTVPQLSAAGQNPQSS